MLINGKLDRFFVYIVIVLVYDVPKSIVIYLLI